MSKKIRIKAVHEEDLENFLESIGLLELFERGELRCSICEETITKDNFLFVYASEERLEVCCDKKECYKQALYW